MREEIKMAKRRGGHPALLTTETADQLVNLISIGCTVADACASTGVAESTYYLWQQIGRDLGAGKSNPRAPKDPEMRRLCIEFAERIGRAQVQARVVATNAVRTAFSAPLETVTTVVETFEETRLRRDASGAQVPYQYVRTIRKTTTTVAPPDASMAIEYLKRRSPADWSDRLAVRAENWRTDAIAAIRAGEIDYEALATALNDEAMASQLFEEAGLPPSLPRKSLKG
jgi:hypothetical protein